MARLRRRLLSLHRIKPTCCSVLLFAAVLARGAPPTPKHIRNFAEVDQTLWRGGEPTPAGLQELDGSGVKLVIDLRESGGGTLLEKQQAEQLGMKYVNLPFKPFSAPTSEQMRTVLFLLTNRGKNVIFIHCRRGKDRTGTVIACYRIQHDGWTNAKALEEAREFGMSWTERGMRSFVLSFSPFRDASLIPTGLQPATPPAHP
ncbi:MAG: tyrosine-protein phosphatase [Acidobacteriaceae bacterium]|nr:tyrosine-protein phosphatase [Acidobacteriaceae bacterium]